jgi:hypothetical protein
MSRADPPSLRAWSLAHDRERPELNEDAWRADVQVSSQDWTAFLAVSDGVGSTTFAGAWARALVAAAEPAWASGGLAEGAEKVRETFDPLAGGEEVDFILEDLWHERGSAATLLVASVESRGERTSCNVAAVGDSVLIVSQPERFTSFPLSTSGEFSNRTEAVRTRGARSTPRSWTGQLPAGSAVALASDGIGKWIVRRGEDEGAESLHLWLKRISEAELPDLDDDLTLMILDVPDCPPRRRGRLCRSS